MGHGTTEKNGEKARRGNDGSLNTSKKKMYSIVLSNNSIDIVE